tara:strand:- start:78 stop:1052 length:975 start_codon:yes stop_codon:yes gene_type:complete
MDNKQPGKLQPKKLKKYVTIEDIPRQKIWDASSLSSFSACPRMYNLSNLLGYKMKSYATVTGFGSAVHDGFEILDKCKHEGKHKNETVLEATTFLIKEYGEELNKSEDKARGLEAALRAIVWRAEEYWEDNLKIATMPNGAPCLETRFEVPFGDRGHRFSGRIDKIVEMDNRLYLCDTKTTKTALSDMYFRNFQPNNQIYAYIWAARKVMGLDIAGFIIDAVQTGVHFCRFNRSMFNVSSESIEEWYADTQYNISLSDAYADNQWYPANFTACGNYGGCKFREVCAEPPDHRAIILNEDFIREPHPDLVVDNVIHAENIFKRKK